MNELPNVMYLALVSFVVWSVVCRARHMDANTDRFVRWQHGLLNAFVLCSLLDEEWRSTLLAAGMAAFFLMSYPRWRHMAPAGTRSVATQAQPRQCTDSAQAASSPEHHHV